MSWQNDEIRYLEALGRGDSDAFAALYEHYAGKCLRFVIAMTRNEEAAKDITHDVFKKVWVYRESISKVESFNSYIFRMTRNAVMDLYERNDMSRRYVEAKSADIEDFRHLVDEKIDSDTLNHIVSEAVRRMPQQRARVFLMSRLSGVSNPDIASSLGLSIRTVEKHISNALSDIRKALEAFL